VKKNVMAVVACAALLASACGSRVDNDDSAGGLAPPTTAPATDAGGGDGMFGTLPVPCSDGDTSDYPDSSERGVTKDSITIATIADPGGPRPGLNQGIFDTMVAFADWCNGLGGINGREVKVDLLDAKILQYKEQVLIACDSAFALVGGLGVLDDLGAQDAVDCGLPNIPAAAVSQQATDADLTWQALPNPSDVFQAGMGKWVVENYPDAVTKAATVRGNLPVIIHQSDRVVAANEQVGYDFISVQTVNVAETNWAPFVLNMKNAGVLLINPTATYEEVVPMLKSMNEQGFAPELLEFETNYYNQQFPKQAAAQGVDIGTNVLRLTSWPFEEADQRPAMAEYLRLLEASSSAYDTDPQQLGVQAMSAALLWATAVDSLGADVTSKGLQDALDDIRQWDGGGLHGVSDPGGFGPSPCFIVMTVTATGFDRVYPLPDVDADIYDAGNGMACPSGAAVSIPQFGGNGAKVRN